MNPSFDTPRADEFLELLESRLPKKTLHHVESVAQFMLTFASKAGISDEQAVTAGLLHDLCKALPKDELAQRARHYGLTEHLDNPNLLHGPVAAEECIHELGIADDDIIDAIRHHTTGRKGWGPVGCALYVGDFAEPLRTLPEADKVRNLLINNNFHEVLLFVARTRETYVRQRFTPDKNSLDFFEWISKTE